MHLSVQSPSFEHEPLLSTAMKQSFNSSPECILVGVNDNM
jgi:hypothetical protein